MFSNHHGAKSKDVTPTKDKIYQVLLRGLDRINVDTIMITEADYHMCRWPPGDTLFSGSTINAHLYHINISDSTSMDTSRILFAKYAALTIKKVLFRGKKPLYHYRFNDIQINSDERLFTVKSMNITPLLSEAAFVRASKWQTDRLDFSLSNLHFKQVQIPELLNGNLMADELSISHARFKVFRDKTYPLNKISRVGTYPFQLFVKLPVEVFLKKVVIEHAFIEYKEKEPQTGHSGVVTFDDAHATLHNVTNRPADLRRNAVCTLNFTSQFLNKIPLSATLKFYLNSNNGKFTVNGTMGATDATIFNPLSKPMALVEINSCNIKHLNFQLSCTDHQANGSVRLLYDDLKIKLLKKDDPEEGKQVKKVASFLANMSIINSNPAKNKPVRVSTVSHPRNIYASMYNLIWKSIFEGVQKTIGLNGKIP
jgi:WD40 repeat protein